MSNNTAIFLKSEWLSLGKWWKDLPSRIKKIGRKEFSIPATIHPKILPSSDLSVDELVAFSLPNFIITANKFNNICFFSKEKPESVWEKYTLFGLLEVQSTGCSDSDETRFEFISWSFVTRDWTYGRNSTVLFDTKTWAWCSPMPQYRLFTLDVT